MIDESPRRLGPYRIERPLGRGSFSRVFLAIDTRSERRVALKVLAAAHGGRDVRERFEIEKRALAQMNSDFVARLYDSGEAEGQFYFAMEFVEGLPLVEFCDRNGLSIRRRLELFDGVCSGVLHIHQRGVIHRDLKPSNVLVTDRDGRLVPKIIDLGLARGTDRLLFAGQIPSAPGEIYGTLRYMSPEQARPRRAPLDTRTDLHALGAILYELLAGELPVSDAELAGLDVQAAVARILQPAPLPSRKLRAVLERDAGRAGEIARCRDATPAQLVGSLIGDLDQIVMKAMEHDLDRRYQTVSELAEDLLRYLRYEPVSARPSSRGDRLRKFVRRNRSAVIVTGVLLAASTTTTVMALRAAAQATENERLTANNLQLAKDEAETARENARLARSQQLGTVRALLARGQVAAGRGDFPTALSAYDEARGFDVLPAAELDFLRADALAGARRYAEAKALLATIPGGEDDARVQLLAADLGVERLRDPFGNLDAVRRALALDAERPQLEPADRLYARALLAEDPVVALELLQQGLEHDPFHRQINDCLGTTLLLLGRLDEAREFLARLQLVYPDDPQTWFLAVAVAGVSGARDETDRLLGRIEDRFGRAEADLAELIARVCELVPWFNGLMRDSIGPSKDIALLPAMGRLFGLILPLRREVAEATSEDGLAAGGVTFVRMLPSVIDIYRPLWVVVRGENGERFTLQRMLAAFEEVAGRSVEGALPYLHAAGLAIAGRDDEAAAALRRSLSLPSAVFERRTALLLGLQVASFLLAGDGLTESPRAELIRELGGWVDEACDLPNKTADECHVIYFAAWRSASPRLPELVACWNRLAPAATAARLARAEQWLLRGAWPLAAPILEAVLAAEPEDWERAWAEKMIAEVRRRQQQHAAAEAAARRPTVQEAAADSASAPQKGK